MDAVQAAASRPTACRVEGAEPMRTSARRTAVLVSSVVVLLVALVVAIGSLSGPAESAEPSQSATAQSQTYSVFCQGVVGRFVVVIPAVLDGFWAVSSVVVRSAWARR